MALLQELNGEGLTVLLVTHEPDIASYAGRLLLVKDGRLRTDEKRKALSAKQALSEWRDEETLQ
jgi:putative ABC transport system ATP-binding protein